MILGAAARPHLDLRDPVCDAFFQLWQETAESNANIYEQVGGGGESAGPGKLRDYPVQGEMERSHFTQPFS